ncbi:chemotaxis protein MotB [Desulfomicrobium apsheronum]|uniref:Chemotaxis protein MotB n=1 Tax=Desulfomicrobium apsheronum TaxID=52560 RepID=A0A1I3XFP0_9BACT|nr:flagellar motor protein MotB [Desulfomicrobium apsheronum]SFK17876.1 chemotaxis protein MotB [Desulfomicrobium apsheronum]
MISKRAKTEQSKPGVPSWMITFSDLVTLLMTFFIVLVSMASLTDIYKRKVAIGSVSGTFGTGAPSMSDLTTVDTRTQVDPGPINVFKDLSPVKDHLWEDPDKDLRFESNRFMQRLSIGADALFAPGSSELTEKGRSLLDRLRPVVMESAHPLGLSGHASDGMDEFGPDYLAKPWVKVDFSWELSLARVMAVYKYFIETGVEPEKLRLEAFGRFRPRVTTEDPGERLTNRRVEIILDRRVGSWSHEMAAQAVREDSAQKPTDSYRVKDFLFRFDLPGEP